MELDAIRATPGRVGVTIRAMVPEDREPIRRALTACGAFSEEEVRVALDMVDAGLHGEYTLLVVDVAGDVCGYACVGRAPLTQCSWYVYWICVHPETQGIGLGRALQARVEEFIRESGGLRLVLETSGRAAYQRTRRFYEDAGFATVGRIPDFYGPDDDCVVYSKRVGPSAG